MSTWVTVYQHKGYDIMHLDRARAGECMDYRISPSLTNEDRTYKTVGDAIDEIDKIKAVRFTASQLGK